MSNNWEDLVGKELSKEPSKFYVDTPTSTPTCTELPYFDLETSTSTLTDSSMQASEPVIPKINHNSDPSVSLCRLYLMSYFPSGFWPRLITRLIADKSIAELVKDLYLLPECLKCLFSNLDNPNYEVRWNCWQTGLELYYLTVKICSIREIPKDPRSALCNYRWCQMLIQDQDTSWAKVNTDSTAILEILIPNSTLDFEWAEYCECPNESIGPEYMEYSSNPHDFDVIDNPSFSGDIDARNSSRKSRMDTETSETKFENRVEVVYPTIRSSAALLARVVEHVDNLLEDWYPDLGLRFVQNSLGMYLITRIVPCMHCLKEQVALQAACYIEDSWQYVGNETGKTEPVSVASKPLPVSDSRISSSMPNMLNNNWVPPNPVTRTVGNVISYAVDKLPR